MAYRWKQFVRKISKYDPEDRPNPHVTIPLLSSDDYQAPITPGRLRPNSKWLIIRNNIHKIRSWAPIRRLSVIDQPLFNWYMFLQMKRELKRAEEQIRAIEYRPTFTPIQHFNLHIDETHIRRYNVSHVRPSDGIYYSGLSSQPIVLQYLLYYFDQECFVPYNSIFYSFLADVNAVLHTNRQRLQRVVVYRRVALVFTLAIFILLFMMFFSLILGVFTTTSNLRRMYRDGQLDGDGMLRQTTTSRSLTTSEYEE